MRCPGTGVNPDSVSATVDDDGSYDFMRRRPCTRTAAGKLVARIVSAVVAPAVVAPAAGVPAAGVPAAGVPATGVPGAAASARSSGAWGAVAGASPHAATAT